MRNTKKHKQDLTQNRNIKVILFAKHIIDSFCIALLNVFIRPFLLRKPKYDKKYNVSICAIFKNEAQFIKEWLTYYEIVGINHFYLYNNNSDDNYKEIIQPFIDKGVVTLIDWPYPHAQIEAYKHFYETYRNETQWISFLDLDEFVVPRKDATILEWIKKHDRRPVNLIYWKMFGSSGKLKHDYNKLVAEQYTVSWDGLYEWGKCFINTDYDIVIFNASTHHATHIFYPLFGLIKIGLPPINQFGAFVIGCHHFKWLWNSDHSDIQINHYWSKAWDIYDSKRQGSDVYFEKNPKADFHYFLFHEMKNTDCDHSIFRFIIQVKLRMDSSQV